MNDKTPMTLAQMREFLSHLSDDTLRRVEAAAAKETVGPNVTPDQLDRGYRVIYAIGRVYNDRDRAERRLERAEQYW